MTASEHTETATGTGTKQGKINFLFWNVGRAAIDEAMSELTHQERSDLVLIAESSTDTTTMEKTLRARTGRSFHYIEVPGSENHRRHVRVFTVDLSVVPRSTQDGLTVYHISDNNGEPFLLAAAHLRSKLFQAPESAILEAKSASDKIRSNEAEEGHRRTILVGDLNANPFEPGVVMAQALHGVMDSRLAESRKHRQVQGQDYPFFYNPSWRFLGSARGETHGTYFYPKGSVCYFWNMFDQVLVRPALIPYFSERSFRIITMIRSDTLLTENGIPLRTKYSDHLPVTFSLDFSQKEKTDYGK